MGSCIETPLIVQLKSLIKRLTGGSEDLRVGGSDEKEMVEMAREEAVRVELYASLVENQVI